MAKNRQSSALWEAMDLPTELVSGSGQMVLSGNRALEIDCCRGVLEISPGRIRLRLHRLTLTVTGENLCLNRFADNSCQITGRLEAISFAGNGKHTKG